MKHIIHFTSCILLSFTLASCATMFRGTTQQISINTEPTGAHVQLSNGKSCTTPCNTVAKRNESLLVTITKEGYQTHTASMVPSIAGAGILLGGVIDYGTGAVYDLQPNPLHVTLVPK